MLVKMAGIVQKIIASEQKVGSENEFGLSETEKEQLLKGIDEVVVDLQKRSDEVTSEVKEKLT